MIASLLRRIGMLVLCACASAALADPVPEADVKAAFIFNFIAFTEWPGDAVRGNPTITVCVPASSPLNATLSTLDGRAVKSRFFKTHAQAGPDDVESCNVVIVDATNRTRVPAILRAIGARPVLTIGDGPDMERDGLAVSLSVEQSRLRFRVNLRAAKAAQIEISSKLLRLAQAVE